MNPSPPSVPARRPHATLTAVVLGVLLGTGLLAGVHHLPPDDARVRLAQRYLSHWVEVAEVLMFFVALVALALKVVAVRREARACDTAALPAWDGKAVPVAAASGYLADLDKTPRTLQDTLLVRRARAVLEFLRGRGSAAELDDQLRALADNDALALDGSYSLLRFLTWAIPILGFLGTVLGITDAITGVTPEVLEQSLSTVTDGLATAFDTTALALALTMILMCVSSLTERAEQGVLARVDAAVDRELAHRFERTGPEESGVLDVVRRNADALLDGVGRLTRRQAEVWAAALAQVEQRAAGQQEQLAAALEAALTRTLAAHARCLADLEQQAVQRGAALAERLAQTGQVLTAQVEALTRLQEGGARLVQLQQALEQNLGAVAQVGSFEEAVHSLTAAIHLLTARSGVAKPGRPGVAA